MFIILLILCFNYYDTAIGNRCSVEGTLFRIMYVYFFFGVSSIAKRWICSSIWEYFHLIESFDSNSCIPAKLIETKAVWKEFRSFNHMVYVYVCSCVYVCIRLFDFFNLLKVLEMGFFLVYSFLFFYIAIKYIFPHENAIIKYERSEQLPRRFCDSSKFKQKIYNIDRNWKLWAEHKCVVFIFKCHKIDMRFWRVFILFAFWSNR